jgi:hypothetical protein
MNQPTALFSDTFDLPLADIHADPARFQGRLGEFSEDTVNAIVGKGHYDRSKSPITVWRDPANGKFYILSGHSRFEAAKRIYASGKQPELASLPVKQMMVDDVTAAIEYAVLESNRKSTEEGLVPDIMAYRKAVQLGKNAAYLKSIFRPDSRFQKLKELSTLNPKGMFIEQLAAPSQHSFPYLERNARWVGNMRAQFSALTDLHERELFDYLYGSKKGLNITKQQFFDLVNSKVSRIDFDPANALNLANRISPTAYTDPINEQLREIDKDIATTEREIENLRTNLARAKSEGIAPPLVASTNQVGRITMEARISELNNHIVTKYQAKAKLQQDAGRLERTMGGDLFSMMDAPAPAPAPEQAAELPMDDAPELLQWYPMDDWETNLLRARKTYLSNFDDKTRAAHRKALGSEWVNIWSDLPRLVAHINEWRAGRPDAPPPQPRMINPTFSDESTMKDKIIAKVNAETDPWQRQRTIDNIAYSFAGPRQETTRQRVLLELTGNQYPKAKAGVHEIKKVITELVGETPEPAPVPVVQKVAEKPTHQYAIVHTSDGVKAKAKPIRKLGTGSNVYFETDRYRVNDYKDGTVLLLIQGTDGGVPVAERHYANAEDAVTIAQEVSSTYPKGVPAALAVHNYVDRLERVLLGKPDAEIEDSPWPTEKFPHRKLRIVKKGNDYLVEAYFRDGYAPSGYPHVVIAHKTPIYANAKSYYLDLLEKSEKHPSSPHEIDQPRKRTEVENILEIDEKLEDRKVSSFSTQATPHPRFGTLYVASYPDRVSKQQFDADLARAKKLGGWYSSFNKNGAVAGFQFKLETQLQNFTGMMAPLEPSAPQAPKNAAPAAPEKERTLPYGEIPYFNFDASYDKLYNINGLTPTEELVAMGILRLVEWDKVYNRFNKKVGKLKTDKYDKIGIYDSYIKDYNNQNRKGIVGLATGVAGRMVKSHVAILNVSPLDVEWAKNKHAEAVREKHGPELRAAAKALAGEATYAFEVGDSVTFRDKPWEVVEKRGDGLTGPRYIIREMGTVRELGVNEKEISAASMKPESNEIEYTVTVKDLEMPSRQEYKQTKQSDRREHPMIQVGNLVDRMFKGIGPIWPMMRRGSEWLYDTEGMKPKRVVINVSWVNNHTVRVNWVVQQKTYGQPFKYMTNGQVSTGTKAIYRHSEDDDAGITVNVGQPLQVNTGDTIVYGYSQDTSGTGKVAEVYFDPLGKAYDVRVKRKDGDDINVNVHDITLVVAEQPKKANEKVISLEPMNKIVQRSPIQAINGLALFTSSAGKFVVMGKEIQKVSTNYNKDFIMDGAKPNAVFWLAQNIKMYPQERMFTNPAEAQRVPLNKIYSTKENKESSFIVAAAKMMEAAHGNGEPRGPITVEKMPDGRYHVKDGNATFEVAKRSGWDYIPAIVVNEQPTQITDPKRKRMLMMAKAAAARARALELK